MSFLSYLSKLLLSPKKNPQENYFFALNIGPKIVEAALWGIEGRRLQMIASSHAEYQTEDELIHAANVALDEALADFQPEPQKILFGVPQSWLQDDNLKPERLNHLKKMVKELEVSPMAYVSTAQAVSHYLQKKQGVPLTAVLVEIEDPLTVSVVKAGKIVASKDQKRSANLPEDIEKALLTFDDIEVLPSRILIYGNKQSFLSKEQDQLKDELSSFPWMSQLPFLHLPKIDTLETGIGLVSVCLAGASEINPNLSFHTEDLSSIAQKSPIKTEHLSKSTGFISGDIAQLQNHHSTDAYNKEESFDRFPEVDYPADKAQEYMPVKRSVSEKIQKFLSLPLKLLPGGATVSTSKNLPILPKLAIILPALVILLVLAAFLFLPKSRVNIFIDLRILEKESTVTADPTITQVQEADKRIPGKIVEATVVGSSKGSATGKKQIGDPAKGSVLIYNKTSSPKTFSQGTVLVSPQGLTFTLEASVNVASSSAVEGGIAFGKQTGNVTASNIGPDGNIPAGTELTIKDQSPVSFGAKSDSAFSGGISKDVMIVTTDDQKKLLALLTSDLRKKAQEELQGKLTAGQKILEEALSEDIIKSSFSKGVNDQGQDFMLNLTVHYKGTAYSENDLKLIVSKLVETNVPQGYELDLSKTETQAQVSRKDKDGKLVFISKFRAKLSPKIDVEKVKKDLAGRSVEEAAERIKSIDNVIGSEIELKPKLPLKFLQRLPFLPQNITIEVTAK